MAIKSDIKLSASRRALAALHRVDPDAVPWRGRGVGPIEGMLQSVGLAPWFAFGVFVGEIIAPLLVMAGLWVRWAALLMVINMLFAIGLAHLDDLFVLTQTGAYRLEAQAFFLFLLAIERLACRRQYGRARGAS